MATSRCPRCGRPAFSAARMRAELLALQLRAQAVGDASEAAGGALGYSLTEALASRNAKQLGTLLGGLESMVWQLSVGSFCECADAGAVGAARGGGE